LFHYSNIFKGVLNKILMAQNLYDKLQALTPGNVPADCHLGSNEQSRPYATVNENRVLFSSKFVHNIVAKGKRKGDAEFMRSQSNGVAVPCFLQTEEFLARIGELPEDFQPGYNLS
jgi:hypothetical protein